MKSDSEQSTSGPPRPGTVPAVTSRHAVSDSILIPAVCPLCLAPGTRPTPIPAPGFSNKESTPLAYYCDICAESRSRRTTERLAIVSASVLFVLGATTALTLAWGSRSLPTQVIGAALSALLIPEAFRWSRAFSPEHRGPLELRAEGHGEAPAVTLICRNKNFAPILERAGFPHAAGGTDESARRPFSLLLVQGRLRLGLLTLAAGWLFVVHSLGGATVRALTSGDEAAILLVDSRRSGTVPAGNAEDPRAGRFSRVLGGRRNLKLVALSGQVLADKTVTIWPGRTYIVGHLPQGRCLYWETRDYDKQSKSSQLLPLLGEGPVWSLRASVDSWFIPLAEKAEKSHEVGIDWELSGGIRRGVRLLPCRAGGLSLN